ncbi:MAG TPA: dipeptide ABC transporter ATP-binding protein [Devosia sp.]|jgi:oligopeptide/dipeptide ABC transporter ATP-binding protein|uniref:ABC transporter ATP-binding protein n=1 Tax=Devosia sp. TaxID=1871048 RepID=UPI002DDCB4A2|nr:dipeptide ABC transporter ATP-binding protein [Devosia sp.]HEV2514184.1 dipeptide ABC transporter ATP-binding protein [Devosia sp.]
MTARPQSGQRLLEVKRLSKSFPIRKGLLRKVTGAVHAVDDVSFEVEAGETLSLVGESGCGKTTTARCVVGALDATAGELTYYAENGAAIDTRSAAGELRRRLRRDVQMVFQDPISSLNPRMMVLDIIAEPLLVHGVRNRSERQDRVAELMRLVGLRPEYMQRYPHAFSGGQRQRIGIARAIALNPRLVVADEPVSALDVSVQAQVVNLLLDLQDQLGISYLFVAHDLSVVKHMSDRVAVMYLGRIVEITDTVSLYEQPMHPYTEALLSAAPEPDPRSKSRRIMLAGEVPDAANPPTGCHFHPRCPYAVERCGIEKPSLDARANGRRVACHRADELNLVGVAEETIA